MRQLRDDTHLILDGEVRVYRRERSKRWQAAFVIDESHDSDKPVQRKRPAITMVSAMSSLASADRSR